MALSEKNRAQWDETLHELELLKEGETFDQHTAGDYWTFGSQTRGNFFFTSEKMIFISGWGVERIVIPYKDIKEIKKCFIGPFIPTGIKITAPNEKGKDTKYKFSVMKRNDWIAFLSEKSGVQCQ